MATYTWEYGAEGTGLHFTIVYDIAAGTFTVESLEGKFDLNALWWNDGADDGTGISLSKSDNSLNMNGTGEDWDGMLKLSSTGLGKEGEGKTTFVEQGETAVFTLADFGITGDFDPANGGTLGVRATSVNGGDSIKLVDTDPVFHDDAPPPADDFPDWQEQWGDNVGEIILYFDQDAGDTKPVEGKQDGTGQGYPSNPTDPQDGDGYYLVKISNVPTEASDDLDEWIGGVLTYLIANDPNVTASSDLAGVVIKGGNDAGSTDFYAYGSHNTNGTDPDPIPAGAPDIETPPAQGQVPGQDIDQTYDYTLLGI